MTQKLVQADLRRTLFSGFREGNQQHRVNHPRYGLDNWVYLANGDSDGEIRSAKTGEIMNISGRDLRIRPDEGLMDTQSGRSQYGRNRDNWGNWFGCVNNNPGWHYALADHYIRRNPYVAASGSRRDLTPAREVYPSGRVITHCFIPQPTPPEGQPGSWTCISSLMVYRDELLGPLFDNNMFVVDAVYNVVHRMVMTPQGVTFKGRRPVGEEKKEFLCSADPWFRPTTVRTGPDGALWVVDMYRFVIEHPEWIDIELAKTLDLREGHDRGRIYRIYPIGKKPRAIPRLDKLDTAGLVAALDSTSGWQRDMAQQMLIWRNDKSAVGPLEKMVVKNKQPLARLHALCTLDGLAALCPEIVAQALSDPHPGVRRHAIRLSEPLLEKNPALGNALLKLVDDKDSQVGMQLAYTLGQWRSPRSGMALGRLAVRAQKDSYLLAAVMSSAVPHVDTMLKSVKADTKSPGKRTLMKKLEKLAADIEEEPELAEAAASNKEPAKLTKLVEPSRERVEKVLGRSATVEQIQKAMNKYLPVIDMFGDPQRGKKLFVEATCDTCHKFKELGERIGPDLETLNDRSSQNLIVSVIDPNRAILDRFVQYVATTVYGKTYNGMLLEESSNSLTLVDIDGNKNVVLRKDIEELFFTGRSFMPEGLEATMDLQEMADLFAFIGGKGAPPKKFSGNKPRLIYRDKDTCFDLRAAHAEIYGPDIHFQQKGQNLGNWTCPRAFAAWSIQNAQMTGKFQVVLDLACDPSLAGGRFLIQLGNQQLNGTVPDTGGPDNYRNVHLGQVNIRPGRSWLSVRPHPTLAHALMNLRAVRLVPVEAAQAAGH